MNDWKRLLSGLAKYKAPLLVLLLGVLLMLIPTGEKTKSAQTRDEALGAILSQTQGVGEARVLISENGVVVACRGADNASVKLDIIRAVSSYTGFGSDKITILKLRN